MRISSSAIGGFMEQCEILHLIISPFQTNVSHRTSPTRQMRWLRASCLFKIRVKVYYNFQTSKLLIVSCTTIQSLILITFRAKQDVAVVMTKRRCIQLSWPTTTWKKLVWSLSKITQGCRQITQQEMQHAMFQCWQRNTKSSKCQQFQKSLVSKFWKS